jgi:Holliday junction resolvase-like predicted endonuclease
VGPAKQRHLINAANGYINYYHLKMEIQYDVVIVVGQPGSFKIQFIPDAFYPRLRSYR